MEQKVKFAVIGLVGLLLISFVVMFQVYSSKQTLERQIDRLRNENEQLHVQIDGMSLEKKKFAVTIEALKNDLAKTSQEREDLQKKVSELNQELEGEKNDKAQIEEQLKDENLTLKKQLKNLSDRKEEIEKTLVELQEKNNNLEKRFNETDALLKDKTLEIENLKKKFDSVKKEPSFSEQKGESVELAPIVIHPPPFTPSSAPDTRIETGKIIAVNRENNFVVIDVGRDSGVKIGDAFGVYRENKMIASIKVIQLRDSISACDIHKESKAIRIGDTIKLQN